MTGETDTLETTTASDDADFLAEGSEEETPVETPIEETTEEPTEEVHEEEPEKETEVQTDEAKAPTVAEAAKTITAKYPNLFKEFPQLRQALFQSEYYSRVFPTVELAKEAAGKVEQFEELGEQLISGDPGTLLDSIYDLENVGPKAVAKLVENFLPTVLSRSESLWHKAVDPVFRNTLEAMRSQAKQEKNKNLWITAQNLSQWLYGTKDAAPERTRPDPEKEELRQRLSNVNREQEERFVNGIYTEIESVLSKEIGIKIDASVPEGLRGLLIEKVIRDIKQTLKQNQDHRVLINRLGEQAKRAGFGVEHRKAILSSYLRAARGLIAQALSKNTANLKANGKGKKVETESPKETVAATPEDGRRIDWTKTKESDYLAGRNIYYKK